MKADHHWAFQHWAYKQRLGNATRKLILGSLATMAESNTGWCCPDQTRLAEYAECSTRTVREHLKHLEDADMIRRRRRFDRGGHRISDQFLVLAPWVNEWPDGEPITRQSLPEDSAARTLPEESASGSPTYALPEAQASEQELAIEQATKRSSSSLKERDERTPPPKSKPEQERVEDRFPEDLAEELEPIAIDVGKILKRIALERGQKKPVTRHDVGHALLTYEDIVHRYRGFLSNADEAAGPPLRDGSPGVPLPSVARDGNGHRTGGWTAREMHELGRQYRQQETKTLR
jgi:hypothetical protein